MTSDIKIWKKDLKRLILAGKSLSKSFNEEYDQVEQDNSQLKIKPTFRLAYQPWYTESIAVIKQIIPDRYDDFVRFYEAPKSRRNIWYANSVISDCFFFSFGKNTPNSRKAYHQFVQQILILESAEQTFESSLFDIKQIAQANLFDSELDASNELNKKGFFRAAGVIAGVVLEKHLALVCDKYSIKYSKKATLNEFNNLLKKNSKIEQIVSRRIQLIGDLRNQCSHDKGNEPQKEDVTEMINKIIKITKEIN